MSPVIDSFNPSNTDDVMRAHYLWDALSNPSAPRLQLTVNHASQLLAASMAHPATLVAGILSANGAPLADILKWGDHTPDFTVPYWQPLLRQSVRPNALPIKLHEANMMSLESGQVSHIYRMSFADPDADQAIQSAEEWTNAALWNTEQLLAWTTWAEGNPYTAGRLVDRKEYSSDDPSSSLLYGLGRWVHRNKLSLPAWTEHLLPEDFSPDTKLSD